jgi:putative ABC transport system permease protein
VRKTVTASAAGARIYGVRPLSEWIDRSYWQVRWEVCLLGAFGGLALLLAAIGLYGVVAYHVTLRTREIGIRMAVGAQPADVLRMVLRQGLGLTLAGVGIGLAASVGLARMARLHGPAAVRREPHGPAGAARGALPMRRSRCYGWRWLGVGAAC